MDKSQFAPMLAQALQVEQSYVSALYARLDTMREETIVGLAAVLRSGVEAVTFQAKVERDVAAEEYARRLEQFDGVNNGLCFGRIDDAAGNQNYIGRIGLRDSTYEPLLVDWRAPAARPFYAASPGAPGDLVRRRHLHTRGRSVIGVDDEVFDLERMSESDRQNLVGEAALLATLQRGRTGRMADVVATIQMEQDRVIRSGLQGILVVQGGPGTGKTVAALHRAAYLLYTYRSTLARRGVLVIGPNARFLRYIEQVIPSLGETDVVLTDLGGLYPGVEACGTDAPRTAVVKGDLRMADVILNSIRGRVTVPDHGLGIAVDRTRTLRVSRKTCAEAVKRARAARVPHNIARKRFIRDMLHALVQAQARVMGVSDLALDETDIRYASAELWQEHPVREALDGLWPLLTPEAVIDRLLSDEGHLSQAAHHLDGSERAALLRLPGTPWTTDDVPLLDEAAELLGHDDDIERARQRAAEAEQREEEQYALGVLQIAGIAGQGTVDASTLAERYTRGGPALITSARAARDRSWVYGHVIVDEAQELSAMAWRMVMRRSPTRSMTVVGDVAQTGHAAGARSWAEMLDPYSKGRRRELTLTVNYRTPAEVMTLAAEVLSAAVPEQKVPESVRHEGRAPRAVWAADGQLALKVARIVEEVLSDVRGQGGGKVAVITADRALEALAASMPHAVLGDRAEALDSPLVLLTVTQAKGLEFDRVVLADPEGILGQSPKGGQDLYVAITRVTRRLDVVHEGSLPDVLQSLARTPDQSV